jgi:rhodanese-related sulfurtransferase
VRQQKRLIHPIMKPQQKPITNVWMWLALAIALLAVTGGFILSQPAGVASPATHLPREVSVPRAAELRDEGALMLDVREPLEWDEVHMPGAALIPLGELASRVSELPKDQDIVVVCRSGNRSQEGRDILLRAGFTNVTSMAGGMIEWRAMGLPVVSGR